MNFSETIISSQNEINQENKELAKPSIKESLIDRKIISTKNKTPKYPNKRKRRRRRRRALGIF